MRLSFRYHRFIIIISVVVIGIFCSITLMEEYSYNTGASVSSPNRLDHNLNFYQAPLELLDDENIVIDKDNDYDKNKWGPISHSGVSTHLDSPVITRIKKIEELRNSPRCAPRLSFTYIR